MRQKLFQNNTAMEEGEGNLCLHLNCHGDDEIKEDGHGNISAEATTISLSQVRFLLATQRRELLGAMEDLLWRVLASEGRSEARLWLCTDIGSVQNVPRHVQATLFLNLIKPSSLKTEFSDGRGGGDDDFDELLCRQALRLACEKQPGRVIRLFAKDSKFIRQFFSGHPKRILGWFENFSSSCKKGNELGAQALAHFAFIHRDKYWKELEWRGTHGQAPATVASKPYYFLDLDVLRTVENFLDYVPEFWSSDELWDSLKEGDILSLDMVFFINKLFQRMADGSTRVWQMLEHFLSEEPFSHLCQCLLSFLGDDKLLDFVNNLSLALSQTANSYALIRDGRKTICKHSWLSDVLRMGAECPSLECAMICNACIAHSRQLLRVLHDEENTQEYKSFSSLLLELKSSKSMCDRMHWALRKEGLKFNKWEMVKWLALESWSIQVLIAEEYKSPASLKALLSANLIEFWHGSQDKKFKAKKDKKVRKERRKKRKKKKRRRNEDWSDVEGLDSSQSDVDGNGHSPVDGEGSWYLSFDNFSMGMEKDELPEQLASYAFGKWLNWVTAQC